MAYQIPSTWYIFMFVINLERCSYEMVCIVYAAFV